ncbi:YqaA family protein [Actimicrobium antarcticum]|uniref:YqaA family protein n=1 Tax=Actimicrobium antarcticum TaxID=1051899 RepID=A0ABP7T9B3_9BURK
MIEAFTLWLLSILAAPEVGLTSVFLVSFISATLLPLGSEPTVFAVIKANQSLFWPVLLVATTGNTLGGIVDYWMGYGAKKALAPQQYGRWMRWVQYFGPKTMLLSWLPVVGDPLCTLGGWARLPFWPCVFYMAIGKFSRYLAATTLLMFVPDDWWRQIGNWF